jgi:hypothetical protein
VELALPLDVDESVEWRRYKITLPFLPPSKNVYDQWPGTYQHSAKAKWRRHITAEVEAQQIPQGQLRIGLAAVLVFPTARRRDPQNYANCLWNWVPDALVRSGVLVDDRDGAIDFGPRLGVTMKVDGGNVHQKYRSRTILGISVKVPRP